MTERDARPTEPKLIVALGNVADGFQFVGPFDSEEDCIKAVDDFGGDYHFHFLPLYAATEDLPLQELYRFRYRW